MASVMAQNEAIAQKLFTRLNFTFCFKCLY